MNYSDDYVFAPTFTSDRHGAAIHFINIGTSKTIASLRSEYSIDTMTVSPDGRNIIYGTFGTPNGSRHIHHCHVNDPTTVTAYYTGHDDVNYVTYSPDGRYITSSATDNTTVVIDLRFPKTILHTFSHITSSTSDGDGVRGITWLSNDELATGAEDGFVRFWDVRYSSQPPSLEKVDPNDLEAHVGMLQSGAGDISTMKFNNDKTVLAIGTGQKALTVYTASRRDRFRFESLPTGVRSNETPEDDPF
ncbi:WD40-repeat-containing domain protein [Paraphysoderma sedebokerense]|nr:WD40-repeat-containing domain protein [Paraphysoderma sedebokerense]